ncbi:MULTISPECIES: RNA polymerase sigma factor [Pedobacter]|uniref:RNA polymerase sigma factor, sigma-70 family n=1 Tax=Pedobacter nyackensis TaxID=475255 RepID=A0A1W2AP43_9SPHI|nr:MULTISPECIES: RNA polymerase sigma factor [Pedobacter]SMC62292.1 RNA polymerase sigma factor, sigma-70 family [Pedobacter nyackensis]
MKKDTEDSIIWDNIIGGDQKSYQKIYNKFFDMLYEYGMRINYDEELVKECIQNLFIKLWVNRHTIHSISNFKPYLLVSLRSAIYNSIRDQKRDRIISLTGEYTFQLEFSAESAYIKKEIDKEQAAKILNALNKLSTRQKEIIFLRYFEELDYKEISQIMNISIKGGYKLTARALDALRDILHVSLPTLIYYLKLMS